MTQVVNSSLRTGCIYLIEEAPFDGYFRYGNLGQEAPFYWLFETGGTIMLG